MCRRTVRGGGQRKGGVQHPQAGTPPPSVDRGANDGGCGAWTRFMIHRGCGHRPPFLNSWCRSPSSVTSKKQHNAEGEGAMRRGLGSQGVSRLPLRRIFSMLPNRKGGAATRRFALSAPPDPDLRFSLLSLLCITKLAYRHNGKQWAFHAKLLLDSR